MNKIYTQINEKTGGKFSHVRFPHVELADGKVTVTVACAADNIDGVKSCADEIKKLIKQICAFNAPVFLDFAVIEHTPRALRDNVVAFVGKFPFASSIADKITAPSGTSVRLEMHRSMYELAQDEFFDRLDEHLKNCFLLPISVETEITEYTPPQEKAVKKTVRSTYTVSDVVPLSCDNAGVFALEAKAAGAVDGYGENITVCGVLVMATEFMSKGGGAKRSRPYEKFLLCDGEQILQCRFFPHGDCLIVKADLLGKVVCVVGDAQVERGRGGEVSLTAKEIATCSAQGIGELKPFAAPNAYATVSPKPYEEYVQASLFGGEDDIPQSLKCSFVAFDFETTGLSIDYDMPTELGAVKIVDGVITETFHTMIDPCRPIPEIVSQKTGITDDMVKGQPRFEDVLPDFFKFCEGSALIGHNIAFDFPFLIKHGNRHGISFAKKRTFDTLGMAPRAIPGIDTLTLDNVLENLGLTNDNAHRALSDATATAKAFIAMSKLIAKQ
ncbi:MAG: hypothetical protein J1G04_00490 [Clostridiales bacterium]|nr:hypothetical protein [Clostridiales bacterium]